MREHGRVLVGVRDYEISPVRNTVIPIKLLDLSSSIYIYAQHHNTNEI